MFFVVVVCLFVLGFVWCCFCFVLLGGLFLALLWFGLKMFFVFVCFYFVFHRPFSGTEAHKSLFGD